MKEEGVCNVRGLGRFPIHDLDHLSVIDNTKSVADWINAMEDAISRKMLRSHNGAICVLIEGISRWACFYPSYSPDRGRLIILSDYKTFDHKCVPL